MTGSQLANGDPVPYRKIMASMRGTQIRISKYYSAKFTPSNGQAAVAVALVLSLISLSLVAGNTARVHPAVSKPVYAFFRCW
jgi:hypothetical protein